MGLLGLIYYCSHAPIIILIQRQLLLLLLLPAQLKRRGSIRKERLPVVPTPPFLHSPLLHQLPVCFAQILFFFFFPAVRSEVS